MREDSSAIVSGDNDTILHRVIVPSAKFDPLDDGSDFYCSASVLEFRLEKCKSNSTNESGCLRCEIFEPSLQVTEWIH
ncbi:unnamed protein product [Echinostoma caproni]|uniref:Uncharacterized protein n=1 Tax=Echinostoma caproni TaxID=27848 RepID=A0A183ATH4_9TREM|nr:unnamed protein product [Echinostoma caproni]